jgi:hypothetical protein
MMNKTEEIITSLPGWYDTVMHRLRDLKAGQETHIRRSSSWGEDEYFKVKVLKITATQVLVENINSGAQSRYSLKYGDEIGNKGSKYSLWPLTTAEYSFYLAKKERADKRQNSLRIINNFNRHKYMSDEQLESIANIITEFEVQESQS